MGSKQLWSGRNIFAATLLAVARPADARGAELTAFALATEGNRYVGEQAKDKVVQIRSEKSVNSRTPTVWYIVYYEPTATLKATEVKFGAGKMLSVTRPLRLLEPATGGDMPLDRQKLKVDSDAAIKVALNEPLLQKVKVTSTELKLERVGQGVLGNNGPGEPVWKVKLWAQKVSQPSRDADIGQVWISAAEGKVLRDDLHLNSLN